MLFVFLMWMDFILKPGVLNLLVYPSILEKKDLSPALWQCVSGAHSAVEISPFWRKQSRAINLKKSPSSQVILMWQSLCDRRHPVSYAEFHITWLLGDREDQLKFPLFVLRISHRLEAETLTCIVKSRIIAQPWPWQSPPWLWFCLNQLPPLGIVNIDTHPQRNQ